MNNVIDTLEEAGIIIDKVVGDEIVCYCPWHEDKKASLYVNKDNLKVHCFNGCIKGNLNTLLSKIYGIPIWEVSTKIKRDDTPLWDRIHNIRTKNNKAEFPELSLDEFPLAVGNKYLYSRGFIDETIIDWGVRNVGETLIFPVVENKVVGYVKRSVREKDYKFFKGFMASNYFFGLDRFNGKSYIIIVEGILDCIWCHQCGVSNVISLMGCELTACRLKKLVLLPIINIYLCMDNDDEGRKAEKKIFKGLRKTGLIIQTIKLPEEVKDIQDVKDSNQVLKIFKNKV